MALNFSGDFFSQAGGGISDLFGASGLKKEASSYLKAQQFALRNAKLSGVSTNLQTVQAAREIFKTLGGQQADVAGAGFAQTGSAGDLLKDSFSQGELTKQMIKTQGLITQTGYQAEAAAYKGQADAASAAAKGKTASGIGSLISAGATLFALSDRRLKDIIEPVRVVNGITIWKYRYKGLPEVWVGVIAQEVQDRFPEAITERKGFLLVDYAKLPLGGAYPYVVEGMVA